MHLECDDFQIEIDIAQIDFLEYYNLFNVIFREFAINVVFVCVIFYNYKL